jgi:thiol-disulfide isomerase/thioredoxin
MTMSGSRGRPPARHAVATLVAALLLTACGAAQDGAGGAGGSGSAGAGASAAPSSPAAAASGAQALYAFTGTTVDGAAFDGAALAGRPTVLWFWAPWCPTCLMQAPGVRAAVDQSGDAVELVGVAGLDSAEAMPEFVRLAKVAAMTHVADEAGSLWTSFGVTQQSYFVFLDADGAETFRGKLGPDEIAARVAELAGSST